MSVVSWDDIDSLLTEWFSDSNSIGGRYEVALLYGKINEKLHEQLRYFMDNMDEDESQ